MVSVLDSRSGSSGPGSNPGWVIQFCSWASPSYSASLQSSITEYWQLKGQHLGWTGVSSRGNSNTQKRALSHLGLKRLCFLEDV